MNRNVLLVALSFFFIFFGFNTAQQYFASIYSQQGIENIAIISLFLLYFLFMVGSVFSSIVVTRLNLKNSMLLASIVYFLFLLVIVTRQPILLLLASAVTGVAAAILWTAESAYVVKSSDKRNYGRNTGLVISFLHLGSFIGIIGISLFVESLGINKTYLLLALTILIGTLILTRLRQLPVQEEKRIKLRDVVELAKTKKIWFALPLITTGFMLFGYVISVIALRIEALAGLGAVGKATSFFYLIPIVFAVIIGKLSDKISRQKILYTLSALAGVGLLAALSESIALICLGIVLIGLFFSSVPSAGLAMLADYYRHKNFEVVSAFYIFCSNLGVSSAMLIALFVPYKAAIYFALALCIITIISLKIFFNLHKELSHLS